MQSEQAGTSTLRATLKRIAVARQNEWTLERQRIKGHTDIAVNRNPIDHVPVPYDRINTLDEASNADPEHVQASARIPS